MKHAGPVPATVVVRYHSDCVELRVVDEGGPAAPASDDTASGYGLAGLRERVGLFGGDLSAGRKVGGHGWSLTARLPLGR
jgi:signal transduction histidine kinase